MGLDTGDIARLGRGAQAQIAAKLALREVEKKTHSRKYHNKPTVRGNIEFDSQKEAARYDELMLLLKAGKIRKLKLQPQFTLQESYLTPEGERIRAIRYVADFAYEKKPEAGQIAATFDVWAQVVEDVKSEATRTDKYKLKRKMFYEKFGFNITEV